MHAYATLHKPIIYVNFYNLTTLAQLVSALLSMREVMGLTTRLGKLNTVTGATRNKLKGGTITGAGRHKKGGAIFFF